MIELLLMRHAKSSWQGEALADHDRPLSKRGRKAAKTMALHMAAAGLVPDLVLCSPARRARDTWDLVAKELRGTGRAEVIDAVYDFGDGTGLLELLRTMGGASRRLLLVGHNPSLEQLAQRLIGSGDMELRARLGGKFPTGALAILRFDAENWQDIAAADGHLDGFIRPRDIQASADG